MSEKFLGTCQPTRFGCPFIKFIQTLRGGDYFPSLKSALRSVGNYFPLLVDLFVMNNEVSPWCKVDKEEKA